MPVFLRLQGSEAQKERKEREEREERELVRKFCRVTEYSGAQVEPYKVKGSGAETTLWDLSIKESPSPFLALTGRAVRIIKP